MLQSKCTHHIQEFELSQGNVKLMVSIDFLNKKWDIHPYGRNAFVFCDQQLNKGFAGPVAALIIEADIFARNLILSQLGKGGSNANLPPLS